MAATSSTPPYSRTRRAAGLLFTAGILGRTDAGLADGFRAQLEVAFDNLEALLSSEGACMADVVRLCVYVTDLSSMDVLNEQFRSRFAEARPTRTTVEVSGLPGGAAVEIEATAACADSST